jgi:hypothetical protein
MIRIKNRLCTTTNRRSIAKRGNLCREFDEILKGFYERSTVGSCGDE